MVLAKLNCEYCLTIKYTYIQANILLNYGSTLYIQANILFGYGNNYLIVGVRNCVLLWDCHYFIGVLYYGGVVGVLLPWGCYYIGRGVFVETVLLYLLGCYLFILEVLFIRGAVIHVTEVLLCSAFMRMLLDGSPVILMVVWTIFATTEYHCCQLQWVILCNTLERSFKICI